MDYPIFIWTALLLLHTTAMVQSVRFFIVPSIDSSCPGEFTGDPCLTLIQYIRLITESESIINSDNVILDIQPGIHRIDTQFSISGIKSFVMTGTDVSFICDGNQLTLTSIANVQISGINFTDCRGGEITSVDNLIMQDCSFRLSSLTLRNVNATVVQTSFEQSSRGKAFTLSGTSMQLKKCYFADNYVGAIHAVARPPSNVTIASCNFTNNGDSYSRRNGAAIFSQGGTVTIKSSSFSRNNPKSVYVAGINSLFVSDTIFYRGRQAVDIVNPRDSVVFLRCNFTRNSASNGGAVSIVDGISTNISFTECNFTGNSASHGGALYIATSTNTPLLSFTGCNFTSNIASSHGGALYVHTTTNIPISFSKCNFIDNQAIFFRSRSRSFRRAGGAVHISSASRATTVLPISLSECNFTNNVATERGGALFLQVANSLILITQGYFTKNRLDRNSFPDYGGAVYVSGGDNQISINEGAFINNTVQQGSGGAFFSTGERTNFSFVRVLFHSNLANSTLGSTSTFGHGGAVHVSSSDNVISVNGGSFVNNRVIRGGGGALYSQGHRTNFSFVDVLFHSNSATFCGVLEVEGLFHDSVNFTHTSFTTNRAIGGIAPNRIIFYRGSGAICIRNASISVMNSTFNNNSAVGNAGVMHIEGSLVEIIDSKFKHNEATLDGGVTYTKLSPNTFEIHRSTFSDNRAGDDGGVVYMGRAGSRIDVNESSFSNNRAADRGGTFVILGSTLNIAESSFKDNTAARGDVINACISEINAYNVIETNTSSRTACISYDNRPLPPIEASTMPAQTEETATTRSIVRRTAAIVVPPQTIVPQTTAVTPDFITEETTTDTPRRVSTTVATKTDSGVSTTSTALPQTDTVSTMGAASQTEWESTTNLPLELSTTTLQAEESTTTVITEMSTSSERTTVSTISQSEATSTAIGTTATSTTGLQTEASTTIVLPETEEATHITTFPQTEGTTNTKSNSTTTPAQATTVISQTGATSTPTGIRLTTADEDATDKTPSSTKNELLATTDSLKGNNNAAGTILGSVGLLMISLSIFTFLAFNV